MAEVKIQAPRRPCTSARNRFEMSNGMRLSVKPRAVTSSVRAPSSSSTAAIRARLAARSAARAASCASALCASALARAAGTSSSDSISPCTAALNAKSSGVHAKRPEARALAARTWPRASSAARTAAAASRAPSPGEAPAARAVSSSRKSFRSDSTWRLLTWAPKNCVARSGI